MANEWWRIRISLWRGHQATQKHGENQIRDAAKSSQKVNGEDQDNTMERAASYTSMEETRSEMQQGTLKKCDGVVDQDIKMERASRYTQTWRIPDQKCSKKLTERRRKTRSLVQQKAHRKDGEDEIRDG